MIFRAPRGARVLVAGIMVWSVLLTPNALASDPTVTALNSSTVSENADTSHTKNGISVAPVVGYDPTFSFVYGAAFFYRADRFAFGTDFNLNFKNVYQFHVHVDHRFADDWEYQIHSTSNKGFDPYYGEGGETLVSDFTHIWGLKSSTRAKIIYHTSKIFSVGAYGDVRLMDEGPSPTGAFTRFFPDETTLGIGLCAEIDTRDNIQDTRNGFRFTLDATYLPHQFSTLSALEDVGQVEGSFVVYKQILDEVIPDTIAAFQVMGGMSLGNPSYMYRYTLGGADQLKGYLDNRFRGKKYYLQQTELRFPIWKLFSGAATLGFGDITDTSFTNPKLSYGIGLRIGLPPDWVSKVRIDVAWGRDQYGFFVNFGQTF